CCGVEHHAATDIYTLSLHDALPIFYMGFGSMAGVDLPRLLGVVIKALNGRRAVVWPGWSELDDMTLPDNILRIDATPHDWLFPRSEEHTSELQSRENLVCRLLLEKK